MDNLRVPLNRNRLGGIDLNNINNNNNNSDEYEDDNVIWSIDDNFLDNQFLSNYNDGLDEDRYYSKLSNIQNKGYKSIE